MMQPAAVLWDMDGTLVDSEPYWHVAERRIVAEHGIDEWTDAHARQITGFDLIDGAAFMRRHAGIAMEPAAIVDYLLAQVVAQLRDGIPWKAGARELLLATVARGIPCALVTMSWRSFADVVLDQLPGIFAASVTGEEVPDGRGKPDPLPYLLAAQALNVDAARCVAIEDSATGVRSALAAGCHVIAVPEPHTNLPAGPRLTIVDSLRDMTPQTLADLTHSAR